MEVEGLRGPDGWLPHALGHEAVGLVGDIGPNVTKVKRGDRVILGWMKGRGLDAPPPVLHSVTGERIHAGPITTFSTWTIVSENRVYLAPQRLDDYAAVLFGCALLTGMGMILKEARPVAQEVVLINGLGGVGFAALIAAQLSGASCIAVDPSSVKRRAAMALGAEHSVPLLDGDGTRFVRERYQNGVDIAIDATGTVLGIEAAFSQVRSKGGRLIFASHPPAGEYLRIQPSDLIQGKSLSGSWGGSSHPDEDVPVFSDVLMSHNVDLKFLTSEVFTLEEVNDALATLKTGSAFRPLLTMAGAGE
jgi:S-(hydroxymethyl)glutathione dehydrogenase/alcohol dehydrogenase